MVVWWFYRARPTPAPQRVDRSPQKKTNKDTGAVCFFFFFSSFSSASLKPGPVFLFLLLLLLFSFLLFPGHLKAPQFPAPPVQLAVFVGTSAWVAAFNPQVELTLRSENESKTGGFQSAHHEDPSKRGTLTGLLKRSIHFATIWVWLKKPEFQNGLPW